LNRFLRILVSTKTSLSFTQFTINSRRKTTKNFSKRFVFLNQKNSFIFFFKYFLAVHDARKNNNNQLGILREILFNERDVKKFFFEKKNNKNDNYLFRLMN